MYRIEKRKEVGTQQKPLFRMCCTSGVLLAWMLVLASPLITPCHAVAYPPNAEPLNATAVIDGSICLDRVLDGSLIPDSSDANRGIVINVDGCYDDNSLGLSDQLAYLVPVLSPSGQGPNSSIWTHLPSLYNITWVQPNYFPPSFAVNGNAHVLLNGDDSDAFPDDGQQITSALLQDLAAGHSVHAGNGSLVWSFHALQTLCAAQCQASLFPDPTAVATGTSLYKYHFRFVLAYGNCYCLRDAAAARLTPSSQVPCCTAVPATALWNGSNWTAVFPPSSAPRCLSSRRYGVLHTAQLACNTKTSRCDRADKESDPFHCRVEKNCCVQHVPISKVPAGLSFKNVVAMYIVVIALFMIVLFSVTWRVCKERIDRRRGGHHVRILRPWLRRDAADDDDGLDHPMPNRRLSMVELHAYLVRMQLQQADDALHQELIMAIEAQLQALPGLSPDRTITHSRSKKEAYEAALEAITLLEPVDVTAVSSEDCCPMCLDELAQQACVKVLCGHIMHVACMCEFLSHKLVSYVCPVTCPMCRATVLVQQRVEDQEIQYRPPPLTDLASPTAAPTAVADGGAAAGQGETRRRRRFRQLTPEEIANANRIVNRLLARHGRMPGDRPDPPTTGGQQREETTVALPLLQEGRSEEMDDVDQWLPRRLQSTTTAAMTQPTRLQVDAHHTPVSPILPASEESGVALQPTAEEIEEDTRRSMQYL